MNYTTHYNLNKPEKADQYNIERWNDNSDSIDTALNGLQTQINAEVARATEQEETNRNVNKLIGTLEISQGGTGETAAQDALNALHGSVSEQADISADDEVTFIKRTAEDVSGGIPASLDVESVKLSALAQKVYDLMRGDTELFSATKNGLVPKAGSAGSAAYLSANGTWSVPYSTDDVTEISASKQIQFNASTIVKITAESQIQLVLDNPTSFGVMLRIMNLTKRAHTLYAESVSSHSSFSILPNANFTIMWNGSAWQNISGKAIGDIYEQKPQTESPFDIFPCSDWVEIISHNGAFYRSANAPTTLYTVDESKWFADSELTHPVEWSGIKNADGTAGTVTDTGNTITNSMGETVKIYTGSWSAGAADAFIEKSGDLVAQKDCFQGHQHQFGYGASGAGGSAGVSCPWYYSSNTKNIVSDGTNGSPRVGKETRPVNFSVRVWKRVA